MSPSSTDPQQPDESPAEEMDADEYGSLTVEDEPGTVDPADLAGTANSSDAEVGYEPEYSEADEEPGDESE
jgi:hypothetical protein